MNRITPKLDKVVKLEAKVKKKSARRSRRREEIAEASINALKQMGYARTGLRDIAELSGVSVGMLHYYFEDKTALINFCVRKYKREFIAGLDDAMRAAKPGEDVAAHFTEGLCKSVEAEAETHRLWYDIRSQALFDADFRDVVEEIEGELTGLISRLLLRLGLPDDRALSAYLAFDGVFRFYLQRHLSGDEKALPAFRRELASQIEALKIAAG